MHLKMSSAMLAILFLVLIIVYPFVADHVISTMSEDAMEISSLMAAAAAATKPVIATATKPSAVVPGSSVVKKKELHMEKCLLMQEEINIPIAMIENVRTQTNFNASPAELF